MLSWSDVTFIMRLRNSSDMLRHSGHLSEYLKHSKKVSSYLKMALSNPRLHGKYLSGQWVGTGMAKLGREKKCGH